MTAYNASFRQPKLPATDESLAGAGWWPAPEPDHAAQLARFSPIVLDEMAGVALLDRMETKFVFHERQLDRLLAALATSYRVLEINSGRLNHYRTLYFDTPDFALFRRHQAGGRNRYKVRSRSYLDSGLSFLELKHKVKRNRTVKRRVATAELAERISAEFSAFLDACLPDDVGRLEPKLWNEYTRITLVRLDWPERVTLDINLQFRGCGETIILPGVAIAEVKRERGHNQSEFARLMKEERIRPTGFSKYCIGVSMLYPAIKHNQFNPKLQMVSRIIREEYEYVF